MPVNQSPQIPTRLTQEQTLELITKGLEKIGDLPIFSASLNRIHLMSSSIETGVMELATEIMKDANLTTKLLRVSNSPYYARGESKVGVISRAIVLLGYETVKSITLAMKVIESFQYKHSTVDMRSLLVKSYMSAGFVRGLALKCNVKDPEESFICALLHDLGDVILASIMPLEYQKIVELMENEYVSLASAQQAVLGTTSHKIAQFVLEKWQFPGTVIKTLSSYSPSRDGPVKDKIQLNRALASLSSNIMDTLYAPGLEADQQYNKLMLDLSEATGLKHAVLSSCLTDTFKMSCDLAEQYGLSKKQIMPKITTEGDNSTRNKIARTLSFLARNHRLEEGVDAIREQQSKASQMPVNKSEAAEAISENKKHTHSVGDPSALISILHEITMLITQQADINEILNKVLEGMHRGVGFDRAMLCFLSPDRKFYKARFVVGTNAEAIKKYFSFPVNMQADLFSKVIIKGEEVYVQDINHSKWRSLLPSDFFTSMGTSSFVAAPLHWKSNPVGLFYADCSGSQAAISPELFRGFVQLVAQASLALGVRGSSKAK